MPVAQSVVWGRSLMTVLNSLPGLTLMELRLFAALSVKPGCWVPNRLLIRRTWGPKHFYDTDAAAQALRVVCSRASPKLMRLGWRIESQCGFSMRRLVRVSDE